GVEASSMVLVKSVRRFSLAHFLTHRDTGTRQCYTETNSRANNGVPGSTRRRLHDHRTGEQRLQLLSGFRALFPASSPIYQPPFIVRKNASNGENQFEGYCIDLINAIKDILKFEYVITEVKDKMFGSIDKTTKQWNGMIRELVDKSKEEFTGNAPCSACSRRGLSRTSGGFLARDDDHSPK
ncbi:hypothetical protein HPB47_011739, partial [Ixodes persulcatus]